MIPESKHLVVCDHDDCQGCWPDPPERVILKNQAMCRKCETVIESKTVHDFVSCECKAIAVDGGKDYLRRVGNVEDFIDMTTYVEEA